MRTDSKLNAKLGHSKALGYRNGTFSAASDLEALVDAYGATALAQVIQAICDDLAMHGDSLHNGIHNNWLNSQPLPRVRKLNKPENKSKSKSRR